VKEGDLVVPESLSVLGVAVTRGEDTWFRVASPRWLAISEFPPNTTLVIRGVKTQGTSVVVLRGPHVSIASGPNQRGEWQHIVHGEFKTEFVRDPTRFDKI